MITQALLHGLFEYKEGFLYWKVSSSKKIKVGAKAGYLKKTGYCDIRINKKPYLAHRLIFMMFNGYMPIEVDHHDNNPSNNKIENLRASTHFENSRNSKVRSDSSLGIKNIGWCKNSNKFRVVLKINGKAKNFGSFKDLELADLVATMVREKYHGEFARHK